MPDAGFENVAEQLGSARRVGQARAGIGWRLRTKPLRGAEGARQFSLPAFPVCSVLARVLVAVAVAASTTGSPRRVRAGRTQEHPGVPVPDGVARGSWPKERAPRAVPRRDCSPPASSKPVNGRSR